MIEIFRKGFRLDIDPNQIITFKKSINLNGVQDRYAYSNTIPMEKTSNNKKLLELFDLPTNKVQSLMNGYEVDVVINGSIQLRKQTLKIQKEGLKKIDTYLLFSDNTLVVNLKSQFVNTVVEGFKYSKTIGGFNFYQSGADALSLFFETQEKSGLFVVEEMPLAIRVQTIIRMMFEQNNYTVFGDFFEAGNDVSEYFCAPNKGVYQIYSGTGEGFSPTFDNALSSFDFLNQTLAFFNCYADVDDTYKTVVVNKWTNINGYKENFVDYSRFFVDYSDYVFESKLAKRNDLTYAESSPLFNSFFPNNLSSQKQATYLASAFGAGSLLTFDDAEPNDFGAIPVRGNGAVGETSAVRIFKISPDVVQSKIYENGIGIPAQSKRPLFVSMQTVYNEFHKDYVDFILTPLITNIEFRYDAILAATFSLTKVFFIEQLSSYWIPLEINFSTKKDQIRIKAALVKKRKVPSPTLNNFNSVVLNFKEKALFPLSYLMGMYPMPPNAFPWDVITFRGYDQDKNKVFVNDTLLPANTLPQSFALADVVSIKFEANKGTDTQPDFNTDAIRIQAIDTNGGISNEAYITVRHSGIAMYESRFVQPSQFAYSRNDFDIGNVYVSLGSYQVGLKPDLNVPVTSAILSTNETGPNADFDLIHATENYPNVVIAVEPFNLYLQTHNNGVGKARAWFKLYATYGGTTVQLWECSGADNSTQNFISPRINTVIPNLPNGSTLRVFGHYFFDNRAGSNSGSMNVDTIINNFDLTIKATKTL